MRRRVVVVVLGVVAGLVLLTSAAAAGGGQAEVVVASSGTSRCTGFVVESLNGAIGHCVPFTGWSGVPLVPSAAASDSSVVFGYPAPYPPCPPPDPEGCGHIPETGTLTELARPDGDAVSLDSVAWDEYDVHASVSADGSKATFLRVGDGSDSGVYVVNADGSGLRLVASGDGAYLNAPAISPDGSSIAYWCFSPPPNDPAYTGARKCGPLPDGSYRRSGLMLMNVDGSDKRMIVIAPQFVTFFGAATGSLSWSPNGRWLTMAGLAPMGCVEGVVGCNQQVFAYRTDGSDLFNYLPPARRVDNLAPNRQVTHEKKGTGNAAPAAPQFCGSSSRILYESGRHAYLVDRAGTHRRRTALDTRRTGYPVCIPPAGGKGPPQTVDAMRVTVPGVRTLGYAAAERRLLRAHLHVRAVERVYSARIRRGHVIAQHPRAGAHAHRSTKLGPPVALVLSRGPRP